MATSLTFSDSESTNSTDSTEERLPEKHGNDSGYDEEWLHTMIAPVDAWMRRSTQDVYTKWRAICNMTLMYHRSLRDLRADLEREELQVHLLKEACARMEAEKQSVVAMLEQAEAARVRAEGTLSTVNAMLHEHMEKWELVDGGSEED